MFISRRQALVNTGISLAATTIAGCATYGKPPAAPAATPGTAATPNDAAVTVKAIASTADIPVGSGVIVDDLVITQPTKGRFNGFSAICTHAGCTVAEVVGASINCPCHGSSFNLDGSVANGPANRPLDAKDIVVQGDSIELA
ncbi:Rieske (2Fe-2S) protein [Mycolicibacterium stellerae]|uniref:Rieske (2Fe-2S) protein n=1 Tax=Mycolicibacterium stellerae TaxID=2358193 RepID=UPI000F0B71C9|nr:Rieske (2Fe-2S) protein [Mycolicibacterium stellerae]